MAVVREGWESGGSQMTQPTEYVQELRRRLQRVGEAARSHLKQAQEKQKTYDNESAQERELYAGQKVLGLLHSATSKFLMCWQRPFEIIRWIGSID